MRWRPQVKGFRAFIACLLTISGIFFIHAALCNPDVPFLPPLSGAQWIDCDLPVQLASYRPGMVSGIFRRTFTLEAVPTKASLSFYAMRDAYAVLDGKPLIDITRDMSSWKTPRRVDLSRRLLPGDHELDFAVFDLNGPPLLAVSCSGFDCSTGPHWQSRCESNTWLPARLASAPRQAKVSLQFPTAAAAVLHQLPVLIVVFITTLVFLRSPSIVWFTPSKVRWLLMFFLAILGINDIVRLPAGFGYETSAHLDYIRFILDRHSLPLGAQEGWQMFQAPLYNLLSAPFYCLLRRWFSDDACIKLLRVEALPCLLALVELCYRALRRIYPDRNDLQIAGLLFAALLPMDIYMCQFIGNEPLSAALTAAAVVYGMGLLSSAKADLKKDLFISGILLGAALLAKTSAAVLGLPFLWLAIDLSSLRTSKSLVGQAAANAGLIGAGAAVAALWYYARNWLLLGKPFIMGSWERQGAAAWWQEPGYRVIGHFLAFGESLRHPIYAGLSGFWDALYSTFWLDGFLTGMTDFSTRPPWDFWAMNSLAWLSLLPMLALCLGAARAVNGARTDPRLRFAAVCVIAYLLASAWIFLRVGNYSAVKASYLCGLAPAFGVLAAAGFERLARPRPARPIVWACLACWAVSSYAAFFVR